MKSLKYIALAALSISFAACEQEDILPSVHGDADAVKITASIGALQTRVNYDAAGGGTTFGEDDQIRVINLTRTGKSKSNAIYKTDGNGNWSPVDNTNYLVWEGSSANTFYGVYPTAANYTEFSLPTNQSEDLASADWMTDDYVGTKSEGSSVDFNLLHRLAKVTVKITNWNSEFDNSEKVIEDPKIYTKGTALTISYGTGTDGADVYTSDGTHTAITPSATGHTYTAIVVPLTYAESDKFMTFAVDGQLLTVLAKSETLTNGLMSGQHYTFDLTVGKDAAAISSVNVNPWSEQVIYGGVAEEVIN